MDSHHYFIAIPPGKQIREIIEEWSLAFKEHFSYKVWVHKDDYHITLAFLGAATDPSLAQMKDNLSIALKKFTPFKLELKGTGGFGKPKTPRVLWAGVSEPDVLFSLQDEVKRACETTGFKLDERPYRPHITIAKKWDGAGEVSYDWMKDVTGEKENRFSWNVDKIVLYKIHRNKKPHYEAIFEFPLFQDNETF
ncbi:RNA 2',3'-cyclic phosphodiesterase [Pseudalkalibacillus caeni]|uniref:RNA 2',3'-cyclic phosphodiesterase n=1 Tax=Exobacillus caeni TaxID=2574798 RepID=UPI001485896D|nr:RNA 2',3'-cyclic phosphodiesterase [Pseudalkalibacillus caeni]